VRWLKLEWGLMRKGLWVGRNGGLKGRRKKKMGEGYILKCVRPTIEAAGRVRGETAAIDQKSSNR